MTTEAIELSPEMSIEEALNIAWCGGYLTARGGFSIWKNRVRLQFIGDHDMTYDDLLRFRNTLVPSLTVAEFTERWSPGSPRKSKEGALKARLVIAGETLHEVMIVLWPYLSIARRYQYNLVRKAVGKDMID